MSKHPLILKLNKNYFPIGTCTYETAIINIWSHSAYPIDITYAQDSSGAYDFSSVEYLQVVQDWDEWCKLPIRDCDDYVQTVRGHIRLPSVVICSKYGNIKYKNVQFPTKRNIWKRDNYTCGYTGAKLSREDLSVDHIMPKSRGGKDEWSNLITCCKRLNSVKSDKTPSEAGLKLLWHPDKPTNGLVFDTVRSEWDIFLNNK